MTAYAFLIPASDSRRIWPRMGPQTLPWNRDSAGTRKIEEKGKVGSGCEPYRLQAVVQGGNSCMGPQTESASGHMTHKKEPSTLSDPPVICRRV